MQSSGCFCTGACKFPPYRCPVQYWEYTPPVPKGWQCPVCGRGNAPTVDTCPCYIEHMPVTFVYKLGTAVDPGAGNSSG